MPPRRRSTEIHSDIRSIMTETGVDDPYEAVRIKARAFVDEYHTTLGDHPPFNVKAAASLRGLHWSDDAPKFSPDSEIAPESDGRVVLRVNQDRPPTRQRFSICHEIGHTLFPDYQLEVRCRKGAERTFADPNDLLETLCDVAASELMFPTPWFSNEIRSLGTSAFDIAKLADDFEASRESTTRRFVELHSEPMAAVFFSWKLKPTEQRAVRARSKTKPMFEDFVAPLPSPKLRVDYRIINAAFSKVCRDYIPDDKSIPSEGPIFEASLTQEPKDGEQQLDFGCGDRNFLISALPIFTVRKNFGSEDGCTVVAVLQPVQGRFQSVTT